MDETSAKRAKTRPYVSAGSLAILEKDVLRLGKVLVEARMATLPKLPERSQEWSAEAMAMAAQAKVLSGDKLEQLVVRLQRHSGRPKEACWRFIIQYGIKGRQDNRRWTETEFEIVREELVKRSIEEVARKVNRTWSREPWLQSSRGISSRAPRLPASSPQEPLICWAN